MYLLASQTARLCETRCEHTLLFVAGCTLLCVACCARCAWQAVPCCDWLCGRLYPDVHSGVWQLYPVVCDRLYPAVHSSGWQAVPCCAQLCVVSCTLLCIVVCGKLYAVVCDKMYPAVRGIQCTVVCSKPYPALPCWARQAMHIPVHIPCCAQALL